MDKNILNKLIEYCKNNFDLNSTHYAKPYQSLSVCILDCVYSLRTKYFKVTIPIIDRYADRFMDGNKYSEYDTLDSFMEHIKISGGFHNFAYEILKNKQELSGRLKSEICYELARKLRLLDINNKEDFQKYKSSEILEIVIRSVKGIGDAGTNYLFMLAGDPNRCKPDVHIHRCIYNACGKYVSNEECQTLLTETVNELNRDYPNLTVALLDSIIWRVYQAKGKIN